MCKTSRISYIISESNKLVVHKSLMLLMRLILSLDCVTSAVAASVVVADTRREAIRFLAWSKQWTVNLTSSWWGHLMIYPLSTLCLRLQLIMLHMRAGDYRSMSALSRGGASNASALTFAMAVADFTRPRCCMLLVVLLSWRRRSTYKVITKLNLADKTWM
jgi:hypothetical protein